MSKLEDDNKSFLRGVLSNFDQYTSGIQQRAVMEARAAWQRQKVQRICEWAEQRTSDTKQLDQVECMIRAIFSDELLSPESNERIKQMYDNVAQKCLKERQRQLAQMEMLSHMGACQINNNIGGMTGTFDIGKVSGNSCLGGSMTAHNEQLFPNGHQHVTIDN